jgi:hypothetical protein
MKHDPMGFWLPAIAAGLLCIGVSPSKTIAQGRLELQRALPLDGPEFIQPSGLAFEGKTLLLVSGTHDDVIFQVDPQTDKAVYKEFLKIRFPKDAEGKKLSWRGIAADKKDNLFLLSESACRILKVGSGGKSEWEGPSLTEAGVEKGLFAGENSGAEGLALMGDGKYLVAASREPRGLIQADLSGGKQAIKSFLLDKSKVPLVAGRRKADFTDLAGDRNQTWALESASDAVCLLKWNGQEYSEGEYWTYSHVANDPKYRYVGLKMGQARGLAVDEHSLYVVLDNKGVSRQGDPADKRPLLLVFKRPR